MFSRRHYKEIATLLGKSQAPGDVIGAFSDMFRQDNSRFNDDKFIDAVLEAGWTNALYTEKKKKKH